MRSLLFSAVFISLIIGVFPGCDKAVDPDEKTKLFYQVPGCIDLPTDSCFTYNFTNNLNIQYCIEANCCPDFNRFLFEHDIIADTIKLFVTDFEDNLCRCICTYNLNAVFIDLPLDSYLVNIYSRYKDSEYRILYSQTVIRN
jgi:hypothetical protein